MYSIIVVHPFMTYSLGIEDVTELLAFAYFWERRELPNYLKEAVKYCSSAVFCEKEKVGDAILSLLQKGYLVQDGLLLTVDTDLVDAKIKRSVKSLINN